MLAFSPVMTLTGSTAVFGQTTLAAAHAPGGVAVGARIDGGGALLRLAHGGGIRWSAFLLCTCRNRSAVLQVAAKRIKVKESG
mmetsp:Transcript_78725/g.157396  ORF Transcript_78725/g.157396 Transcript_78725/m.157396 type:complete len:83 (-) Transcript_78725:61-309(-)